MRLNGNNNDLVFKFKNFISLTLLLTFVILFLSGIVLYIRPEGSIASWTGWTLIGLSKKGWEGIHTLFAALFIIVSIVHICYNWKALLSYLRSRFAGTLQLKRELLASTAFVVVFLVLVAAQWQPLWQIMEWRSFLKEGSHVYTVFPPESDFEEKRLTEIASMLDLSSGELLQMMAELDFVVTSPEQKLSDVARENMTSPEKIYDALRIKF